MSLRGNILLHTKDKKLRRKTSVSCTQSEPVVFLPPSLHLEDKCTVREYVTALLLLQLTLRKMNQLIYVEDICVH